MIKVILISVILLFSYSVSAQQKSGTNPPEKAVKAFQTAHPKAQDVSWDKEGMNYEASYKENNNNFSVVIDKEGKILETESEINISELPSGVVRYINDNYKGSTLTGAAKIVDYKGNVKYEAEMNNGKTKKDIMFDKEGKPIHPSKGNEESEEED